MKHSERSNRNSVTGWLLTIGLLGCFWVHAQEADPVIGFVRGRILEQGVGIPNVHIVDLSTEAATISDAEGYFNLEVNLGDTLLISAVRYQRKTLLIIKIFLCFYRIAAIRYIRIIEQSMKDIQFY